VAEADRKGSSVLDGFGDPLLVVVSRTARQQRAIERRNPRGTAAEAEAVWSGTTSTCPQRRDPKAAQLLLFRPATIHLAATVVRLFIGPTGTGKTPFANQCVGLNGVVSVARSVRHSRAR